MTGTIENICVTIGIPFHNAAHTVGDAIRSVFAQTHSNWKLILINDGSTDGADAVISNLKDNRITYISSENKGLVFWLNYIIDHTDTPYIARMDADDIMHPQRIEKQLRYLEMHPHVDLVDTGIYTMDLSGEPVGIRRMHDIDLSPEVLLSNAILTHPSVMARTCWYKKNKYDEKYYRAEDQELWCRTFKNSVFARIKEPLLIYREGKVNIRNYINTVNTTKKIIRNYGPQLIHRGKVKVMLLKSDLKILLYRAFGLLNKQDYLSSKRNTPLTEEQKASANAIIAAIKKTTLPGIATTTH